MKRHFIVMYVAFYNNDISKPVYCNISATNEDNLYLNHELVLEKIKGLSLLIPTQVIITNIIELTKEDYHNWNLEKQENNDSSRT